MHVVEDFPRAVREIENVWIELSDGCRLAARIWLPADAEAAPVPAILEYLPYRKRDGTAVRDQLTHPYFAGHGYACLRVDIRGNGDSDGLMWDEYSRQELDDALEVIAWIAEQPWCDGGVGMMGISWGGFNALQVAALRPPALKAIITLCSTVDRFADDIHYKGGCLLAENLGWSSTMLSYSSRPPDPAVVGARWRDLWLKRLENQPHLAETWLSHQRRDDYWRHGSVCEDYDAIQVPVLAVGGWGDAYKNAVPQLLENLRGPRKGIVGPWVHKYPHIAVPEPRIGFLQEALRWWDRWLKGQATGVEEDPDYRVFCQDAGVPRASYEDRAGHWIAKPDWPSPNVEGQRLYLSAGGLSGEPGPKVELRHRAPEDLGETAGEYCAIWLGPELPTDQRLDDGRSLVFDSAPLDQSLTILGAPRMSLRLAVDRPQAHIAVRLNAVAPDGAVERLTYGVLNLSHRAGSAAPLPMIPDREETVELRLDHMACRVPAGFRLRVALSTAYWPLIWPDPAPAGLRLVAGDSFLTLPRRCDSGQPEPHFAAAESAPPLPRRELRAPDHLRRFSRNLGDSLAEAEIVDDFGEYENQTLGLVTGSLARERYRIDPGDPSSARMETHWTQTLRRGAWQIRTEARAWMQCDGREFLVEAEVEAFEGETRVHAKRWSRRIARDRL